MPWVSYRVSLKYAGVSLEKLTLLWVSLPLISKGCGFHVT